MPSSKPSVAYIVLAAGLGSRLGTAFSGKPKWFVPVTDDVTLARHQLNALSSAVSPDVPQLVVSGAHAETIEEFHNEWLNEGDRSFEVVHNERFAEWNNWYSLLLALEALDARGWDGPTLVVNGDLFCPASWLNSFAEDFAGIADVTLAVDANQVPSEEAMKVAVSGSRVTQIGKVGITQPHGEYIGLAGLTLEGRRVLTNALTTLQREQRIHDWYEGGVQLAIDDGAHVSLWETPAAAWVEIDDETDLVRARRIAALAAA